MNRRTKGFFISLSQAIEGFVKYKIAAGLSPRTVEAYEGHLIRLLERAGDIPLKDFTPSHVEDFIYWLRTGYDPQRFYDNSKPLSDKTIYNYWVTLKSFFTWAVSHDFIEDDPMENVPKPKFNEKPVDPFTKEEVEGMLDACKYTRRANTTHRRSYRMQRPSYRRDEAIILMLLDSGLRASEMCNLTIGDVDMNTGEVAVEKGKGDKDRTVLIGKGTRKTLWRYLVERDDRDDETAPLFLSEKNTPLNRDSLRLIVKRLGKRAGVKNVHPHRFRHTFAINYLRGGGDIFTLQVLLGHSSLEMVRRYLRIAKIDLKEGHMRSSPVDRWKL